MTTPSYYTQPTNGTRANAFETLAQIQDLLTKTNQIVMDSYAQSQASQTDILSKMSEAADNRARETSKQVADYLEQQKAAAHQPLWKTILTCIVAVVAIAISAVSGQWWLAAGLAINFVMNQLPTGVDSNGNPVTLKNRLDAVAPKWVSTAITLAVVVVCAVGAGVTGANAAVKAASELGQVATAMQKAASGIAAGSTMLAQTGVVGDIMTKAGVDSSITMWVNMGVGIIGSVTGLLCMTGGGLGMTGGLISKLSKTAQGVARGVLQGTQFGAQVAQQVGEVVNGVNKKGQFDQVAETAEAIGALKAGTRNSQSATDIFQAIVKQNADGMVEAREALTDETNDINRAYIVMGRAFAQSAA